jgi:hypothetical protein
MQQNVHISLKSKGEHPVTIQVKKGRRPNTVTKTSNFRRGGRKLPRRIKSGAKFRNSKMSWGRNFTEVNCHIGQNVQWMFCVGWNVTWALHGST